MKAELRTIPQPPPPSTKEMVLTMPMVEAVKLYNFIARPMPMAEAFVEKEKERYPAQFAGNDLNPDAMIQPVRSWLETFRLQLGKGFSSVKDYNRYGDELIELFTKEKI